MSPEKAEQMLREYKSCLGRCKYISTILLTLKDDIKAMEANARDDLINGGSSPQDGMPHGSTVESPTERIALMLASGVVTKDITEAKKQIASLESEYSAKRIIVMFVESWLSGLTTKERWMVERCYFDELTYREINAHYRDTFGDTCSKDLLRRLKKDALSKIYEMAK